MGMQFDRQNRCPKCQPPSKMASVRKKSVDWEKERENNDQTNHEIVQKILFYLVQLLDRSGREFDPEGSETMCFWFPVQLW